jgi:hypothetical protein
MYIGAASVMNDLTDVNMDGTDNIDGLIIQTNTNGSAPGTGTLGDAYGNIGIGKDVYAALTGADYTIAIGYETMDAHTTGSYAIGIGAFALGASTTGADNIAIGGAALNAMDTETNNIAIGKDTLKIANGAEQNTVVGTDAADAVTTGDSNSIIGYNAGGALTEGSENIFIGSTAGDSCTTGSNNILLGVGINPSSNSNDHCLGLGNNFGVAANDFTFGKASNTVTNDFDTDADWSRSSDLRLKRNIQDSTLGLDFINDLRPIKFQWKPSNEVPKEMKSEYNEVNQKNLDITSHGFIAQEVKEAIDKHGDNTFGGWHLDKVDNETQRVKKNMFVMPLIRAVQELTARVKELEDK